MTIAPTLRPHLIVTYDDGSHAQGPSVVVSKPGAGAVLSGTAVRLAASAGDDRRVDKVEFFVDGVSAGTDTSVPFELDWNSTSVANGAHTITAKATDDAGNLTTSNGIAVTVDNSAPPTTAVTAPTGGSTVTGTVAVSANAGDDLGVTKVEFYADGKRFAEDATAPYGASWDTLDSASPAYDGKGEGTSGAYVLTSRAYDASGQATASAPVSVTVANTANSLYRASWSSTAFPQAVDYDPGAGTQQQQGIDVTVQNASTTTWSASSVFLRYRWIPPDTAQAPTDSGLITLGSDVAAGASRTTRVLVDPPALADGVNKSEYRLRFDLYDTAAAKWFGEKGNAPLENPVIVNRVLMTALGLERYYQYDGEGVGAGMTHLVNVANGNSLLRWTPFSAPGRGLSTVVDLTYNSLEEHSDSPIGANFSLAISSLTRLGLPLDVHPNKADEIAGRANRWIEFTDGDGTTHRFIGKQAGDGTIYWEEPAGVHLYLREFSQTDAARKWALTRPDRVTFFYDADGFPTSVEDHNGNRLTFTLEATPPGENPGGPKKRITNVTDAGGRAFVVDYYSKEEAKKAHVRGKVQSVADHTGSALVFEYYEDGNLRRVIQRGGTKADGSFLSDRIFVFTYTTSSGSGPAIPNAADRIDPDPKTANQSTRLYSVRDPRGNETTFVYCSATSCSSDPKNRWKLQTRTDRAGQATSYVYDITTRVTTVQPPSPGGISRNTSYAYDAQGSVTTITNAKSEVTTLAWTADRHLQKVTEPTGAYTEYAYNANGYLTEEKLLTDAKGAGTADDVVSSNQLEYLTLTVDANDVSGKWKAGRTIPHLSLLERKTDPNGMATATPTDDYQWLFAYEDAAKNLTRVTDPEGHATAYTYNADGTLATATDPRGVVTGTIGDYMTQFLDYDANGFATRVIDADGKTTRFTFDADGLLRSQQDPLHASDTGANEREYRTTLDYDSFHRLGRESTPKSTRYERGQLVWTSTDYDPNDNVVTAIGPHYGAEYTGSGAKTTFTHDAMDRQTLVTGPDVSVDPAGERTELAYDAAGRVIRETAPKGVASTAVANDHTVEYGYDPLDRVTKAIRYPADGSAAGARKSHFCYDLAGDLVSITAPKAALESVDCASQTTPFTRRFEYDDAHRRIANIDPLGHRDETGFDANGNVTAETNATGAQTTRLYDERDLLVRVVEPFNGPRKLTTRLEYDAVGNLERVISPRGWDAAGGVAPFTQFVTKYEYDPLNRRVQVDLPTSTGYPAAHYVHQAYDANGNLAWTSLPVTTADPAQVQAAKKTVLDYFDPGWIRSSKDPANPRVDFEYTAEGWQAARTPESAPGERMTWTYFVDGQVKEIVDRGQGRSSFTYDANGNLVAGTDAAGVTRATRQPVAFEAAYNGFDELTESRLREQAETKWRLGTSSYDANGNVAERFDNGRKDVSTGTVEDAGRKHLFAYDQADWLQTHTDFGKDAVSASDDRRITNAFFPTGWERERTIDKWSGSAWQPSQTTTWEYFENGKLKTLTTKNGAGTVLESHTVSYEDGGIYLNGHRAGDDYILKGPGSTVCVSSTCSAKYRYDARDRLVRFEDGHGGAADYTLDPAGNISSEQRQGQSSRTFTYTGDQLQTESVAGQVVARYFYDADGNLNCVTNASGTAGDCPAPTGGPTSANLLFDYAYDYLNRVELYRSFTSGTEVDRAEYTHDALDRPVEQWERHGASGTPRTTAFTYIGLTDLLSEETHTGGLSASKSYSYDAFGHRVALTDTPSGGAPQTYTYAYDAHGSASLLLDAAGQAEASYGYGPYGEIDGTLTRGDVNSSDPTKPPEDPLNAYRYTGKRLDSGSGSYDMGARRFGPNSAHFLQKDLYLGALTDLSLSLDPLTQNRYSLAGGNPLSYVEVNGHYFARDGRGGSSDTATPVLTPAAAEKASEGPAEAKAHYRDVLAALHGLPEGAGGLLDGLEHVEVGRASTYRSDCPRGFECSLRYSVFFPSQRLVPYPFRFSLTTFVTREPGSGASLIEYMLNWETTALQDEMTVEGSFRYRTSEGRWESLCTWQGQEGCRSRSFRLRGGEPWPGHPVFGGQGQTLVTSRSKNERVTHLRFTFAVLRTNSDEEPPGSELGYFIDRTLFFKSVTCQLYVTAVGPCSEGSGIG